MVAESNKGPVKFSNCGFQSAVDLAGSGKVSFNGCAFRKDIQARSPLTVTGCDLRGNTITIDATVPSAIIVGNHGIGEIADASKKAQIELQYRSVKEPSRLVCLASSHR